MNNDNNTYTNSEYGEQLYINKLAEPIFKVGDLEYELNEDGIKFFRNISLDPTVKEKEIYAEEIDIKIMNTLNNVLEHKKYYDEVMKNIGQDENKIKVARLHDKIFKYFFEEYSVLIDYAIAKYGENCHIKFCGNDTSKKIKFDGLIKIGDIEEKIEITAPFYGEERKEQMKQLNRVGMTSFKMDYVDDFKTQIYQKVKDKINDKNESDSYDDTINLVVLFDDFEYIFAEQISDKEFINSIFADLKKENYKFKTVSILVDRYIGNDIKIEPRIIEIKK